MATLQKITPNLWFDTQAEAAAEFYTSIFPNSKVDRIARYPEAGEEIHKMTPSSIMTVDFELDGQSFIALNAGPVFKFNEAISFIVHCDTQQEIDDFWEKLIGCGFGHALHARGFSAEQHAVLHSWLLGQVEVDDGDRVPVVHGDHEAVPLRVVGH